MLYVWIILHNDLNSFYASVEMLLNPKLRGKAIAVAGSAENRHGIILAKSELAKKAGVRTDQRYSAPFTLPRHLWHMSQELYWWSIQCRSSEQSDIPHTPFPTCMLSQTREEQIHERGYLTQPISL